MTRLRIVSPVLIFLLLPAGSISLRADSQEPPNFQEVYDLVRQHLPGVTEAELNRAAVNGFVAALAPKVSLGDATEQGGQPGNVLVSKTSLFEGPIGYIQVRRVGDGLDKAVRQSYQDLGSTNKLSGLVIDLRYAAGADYGAAAATADVFAKKAQPLLDWGKGMAHSKEKADAPNLPLAILVNQKTAAAAEALAAALRETGAGLVLGSRTAGQAMISQEFPLKNGEHLHIATTPIQMGDGSSLSSQGIKPDISVEVSPADERAYYADAFQELSRPGTNPTAVASATGGSGRTRRTRFNEAELVRERRDGVIGDNTGSASSEPDKPVVRDPVLARALDFLKGLSVLRQTHS